MNYSFGPTAGVVVVILNKCQLNKQNNLITELSHTSTIMWAENEVLIIFKESGYLNFRNIKDTLDVKIMTIDSGEHSVDGLPGICGKLDKISEKISQDTVLDIVVGHPNSNIKTSTVVKR